MPKYAEKNMQYPHFAKICKICGKVPNTRQSHIHVFLTCLTHTHSRFTGWDGTRRDIHPLTPETCCRSLQSMPSTRCYFSGSPWFPSPTCARIERLITNWAMYGTGYLLTSEAGSQSWSKPQMGGQSVDNVHLICCVIESFMYTSNWIGFCHTGCISLCIA